MPHGLLFFSGDRRYFFFEFISPAVPDASCRNIPESSYRVAVAFTEAQTQQVISPISIATSLLHLHPPLMSMTLEDL